MSVYKGHQLFIKSCLASLLLSLMAGCGNGGGGDGGNGGNGTNGGSGPPDEIPPTVSSMSPNEDTYNVATNARLTATFSEPMVTALINTDNFRLTDGNSSVSGTVSFDATNNIAVFTPSNGFTPNQRYTATIITGIKDLSGNPITRDFAWCFTAGAAADNSAPSVTTRFPDNGTGGVAVNSKIIAAFNEEMNSFSLTPASFTLSGPGGAVSGTVAYIGKTAIFKPSGNLTANTTYTASITGGATDLASIPASTTSWVFTTGANADSAAPTVSAIAPADNQSNVPIGSTINVSFNEAMDPATMTTANILVTAGGADVIGTVAYDVNSNTAIFTRINHLVTPVVSHVTPVSNLEPNTTYTVKVTTGAKDLAGNPLINTKVWSFTTGS